MKLSMNGTALYFDVVGSGLDASSGFRQKPTLIILHGGPGFDHMCLNTQDIWCLWRSQRNWSLFCTNG